MADEVGGRSGAEQPAGAGADSDGAALSPDGRSRPSEGRAEEVEGEPAPRDEEARRGGVGRIEGGGGTPRRTHQTRYGPPAPGGRIAPGRDKDPTTTGADDRPLPDHAGEGGNLLRQLAVRC